MGVGQSANASFLATASVVNDGLIHATGNAVARGSSGTLAVASTAVAVASASGIGQVASATSAASAFVSNGGTITANANASAVASTVAVAVAGAFGVNQAASAVSSANATVFNSGAINANAHAFASAFTAAAAIATATGVKQAVTALSTGTFAAVASVQNVGFIGGSAHATANAAFLTGDAAVASATARGVAQTLNSAFPLAVVANSGTIDALASANARGFTATAFASAVGVSVVGNTGGGTLDAEITNNGLIAATALAFASGVAQARATALATGIFVATDFFKTGNIVNNGSIFATAVATGTIGTAHAIGINDPSTFNDTHIVNTGLIHAFAQASGTFMGAGATGILVSGNRCEEALVACDVQPTQAIVPPVMTITNAGGTIWAGYTLNGSPILRGNAINTEDAPNPVVIELQGGARGNAGHIFGDIYISPDDAIEVTNGETFLEGNVYVGEAQVGGSLDIFDGGKLVLCQEGWQDACDAGNWGNANWDPQTGVNGPSVVNIDEFSVAPDGTIVYQLTPDVFTHPQVNADNASVNGTLVAQYLPGFYANSFSYEDLVVANSLNTDGLVVKDNSLLLNTTATRDGETLGLDVTRTKFNAVGGLSKNENAAASGIEHVYSKLPGVTVNPASTNAFDQLVAKLFTIDNKATYLAVLDQLSGAQYAQQLQSMVWSLRPLDQSVTDRMNCSLNQPMVPVAQGYSYGCFRPGQFQTWARVWGGWNQNDGDIDAPGYDEQQWAIWGGGDYGISDTFMIGFAGGFFRSNMDFNNFGGVPGGKIEYDGGQIAGYAAWDTTIWYNRAIVSGGWYSGDSHRDFALESSPVDPSGSPDGNAVSFYDELGRRFGVWSGASLTPFAGVTVSHAELDGFTENGHNTGAALKVTGSDGNSVASLLGLRLSGEWWGVFKPQVALAWEHEFDDTFQTINVSFAGAPSGSKFKVRGTDLGEDTFVVDAGAAYALGDNNDLSFRYVGRFLEDYDAQSVMGRWTYKWGGAPAPVAPLK